MTVTSCIQADILREWLQPGLTVRICGQDLRPRSSPHLDGAPLCIQKGQATVIFLEQVPQGNMWLIKIFTPGQRPTDAYLRAVEGCLPGSVAFFTCTQRRLLTREHVDLRASSYKNRALANLFEGAIMMPKVPGTTWGSVADDLRDGTLQMSLSQRLGLGLALARCIDILEAGQCSHRDLSATNVFVDRQGRVWLIDFDCLYHPDLPFQANTTVGTMGYLAPFLRVTRGNPDPTLSWRPSADRFSLAVLIAEILLTGPDLDPPHEDGALFSQAQIDEPRNSFVREIVGRLKGLTRPCGLLLERALGSLTYEACPSPQEWIGALRQTLRGGQIGQERGGQDGGKRRFTSVRCPGCGSAFSIALAKHDELRQKGKLVLCRRCLSMQLTESSRARAQHRLDFPEVSCEHCQDRFSLPRQRLDALRHRGRPILCPECLHPQLEKWQAEQAEYDRCHPRLACAICAKCFRIRKGTLDQLTAKGKAALCPACLSKRLENRRAGKNKPFTKRALNHFRLWYP